MKLYVCNKLANLVSISIRNPPISTRVQVFDEVTSGFISLSPISDENVDCMEMPQGSQSWSIVCEGILSVIGGFPIEIKTDKRYQKNCCCHNFIR